MAVVGTRTPSEVSSEVGRLYDEHAEAVLEAARFILRRSDEAEVVRQDAFVTIHHQLLAGKDITDPGAYLLGVASNLATRRVVRLRAALGRQVDVEAVAAPTEDAVNRLAAARLVRDASKWMSAPQRAAFQLHMAGLSEREIGERLGSSEDSVQKLLKRGRERFWKGIGEVLAQRRDQPAECRQLTLPLLRTVFGMASTEERSSVDAHVPGCHYCQRTVEEFRLARTFSLAPLFPPVDLVKAKAELLRRLEFRPTASRAPEGPGWRIKAATATLLLLIFGSIAISDVPAPRIAGRGPTANQTVAEAIPASPGAQPTPTPFVSACPPGPTGGYAYLSNGALLYRSGVGAPAQRLDAGGPVDDFWWAPDGGSIAYKVSNNSTYFGDVRIVDLATGAVNWDLGRTVTFFSFSPDSRSLVASYPVITNGTETAQHVITGSLAQPVSAAQEFDVAGSGIPFYDGAESPGTPWRAVHIYDALFWLSDAIYLSWGTDASATVHSFSASRDQPTGLRPASPALLARFSGWPAGNAFSLTYTGTTLNMTCSGSTTTVNPATGPGRPLGLWVSPDGRTALVTFITSGGFNVYQALADGRLQALSNDSVTSLAQWRSGT